MGCSNYELTEVWVAWVGYLRLVSDRQNLWEDSVRCDGTTTSSMLRNRDRPSRDLHYFLTCCTPGSINAHVRSRRSISGHVMVVMVLSHNDAWEMCCDQNQNVISSLCRGDKGVTG